MRLPLIHKPLYLRHRQPEQLLPRLEPHRRLATSAVPQKRGAANQLRISPNLDFSEVTKFGNLSPCKCHIAGIARYSNGYLMVERR